MEKEKYITIRGAKEHNLKSISLQIPRNKLVVITGVSGSGKSSLAFETIYTEGRRLYIQSLNSYAKQFESNAKPDVESIQGLSPAIAIDQKTTSRNPRSTVATITEIYDYLRILFVRIGVPHSPSTNLPICKQTSQEIVEQILSLPQGTKALITSPVSVGQKGEHRKELIFLRRQGYRLIRIDDIEYQFNELPLLDKNKKHTLEVILGRITIAQESKIIKGLVENALSLSNGIVTVEIISFADGGKSATYSLKFGKSAASTDAATAAVDDTTNPDNSPDAANSAVAAEEIITPPPLLKEVKVDDKISFSEKFACPISGFCITEIEPRIFSFNSPYGACHKCDGLGTEPFFAPYLIIPDPSLTLREGAIAPWARSESKSRATNRQAYYEKIIETIANHHKFDLDTKFRDLPQNVQDVILYGDPSVEISFISDDGIKRITTKRKFEGVIKYLEEKIAKAENSNIVDELEHYQDRRSCSTCQGYRLRESSLCVKIDDKHIGEVCSMSINNCINWFENLPLKLNPVTIQIADRILDEIIKRLHLLADIGLGYLTLERRSNTLSGGESQRIRLATQIGSGLSNVVYVLDEPSIGLHQSDNNNLLKTLKTLRDQDNTVLVVEHDEDTMREADYLIDIGPGAGILGGEVVAAGTPAEVAANSRSITGRYLSGLCRIEIPEKRREINLSENCIEVLGATANNLRDIDVKIPLNSFVVITGVSGSGKSTFVIDTLYKAAIKKIQGSHVIPGKHRSITGFEHIDKVIEVDQSPIGRTPRSNPATYINVFTLIREWYAALPESKILGYNASRFSFNVKGGRCETCEGDGAIKIDMYFLPEVYVACEQCGGKRYNNDTMQVLYRGKSIADVLDMTTDDAALFFTDVPLIKEKLVTLQEVGLGYIKLGQSATTLSGGEAQRIKLAKELSRKAAGHTLYIFDEPTTGLHSDDINRLMKVMNYLIDTNNSVVIIEHNLDVIKVADYVIDFGPKGGDCGGEVIAAGRPEEIAECPESLTGLYLRKYLQAPHFNQSEQSC